MAAVCRVDVPAQPRAVVHYEARPLSPAAARARRSRDRAGRGWGGNRSRSRSGNRSRSRSRNRSRSGHRSGKRGAARDLERGLEQAPQRGGERAPERCVTLAHLAHGARPDVAVAHVRETARFRRRDAVAAPVHVHVQHADRRRRAAEAPRVQPQHAVPRQLLQLLQPRVVGVLVMDAQTKTRHKSGQGPTAWGTPFRRLRSIAAVAAAALTRAGVAAIALERGSAAPPEHAARAASSVARAACPISTG